MLKTTLTTLLLVMSPLNNNHFLPANSTESRTFKNLTVSYVGTGQAAGATAPCTNQKKASEVKCNKPPNDYFVHGWEASLETKATILKGILGDTKATLNRKAEQVYKTFPSVANFQILNYELCWMYRNGFISCEQYNKTIFELIPIVQKIFASETGGTASADRNPPTQSPTLIFSKEWPSGKTTPAGHDGIEYFDFEISEDKITSDTDVEIGCIVTVYTNKDEVGYVKKLEITGPQDFKLSTSNYGKGTFDTGSIKAFRLIKGQKYSFHGTYDDEKAGFVKITIEVWSPRISDEHRQKFRNSPK